MPHRAQLYCAKAQRSRAGICMCRHGYRHVVDINRRLVEMLTRSGADKAVDMDELLKREALDVIGQQKTLSRALKLPSFLSAFIDAAEFPLVKLNGGNTAARPRHNCASSVDLVWVTV